MIWILRKNLEDGPEDYLESNEDFDDDDFYILKMIFHKIMFNSTYVTSNVQFQNH